VAESLALSIRQPWAWAILYAGKDVENRSVGAMRHMRRVVELERLDIHASRGMTRDEYEEAAAFMASIGVACPPARELARGGIIGSVAVIEIVGASASPWFFGPRAIRIADPQPCDFIPAIGALGLFEWQAAAPETVPPPARWMLAPPKTAPLSESAREMELPL
jgi:hypothetical protein